MPGKQPNNDEISGSYKLAQILYESGVKLQEKGDLKEALKSFLGVTSNDQIDPASIVFQNANEKAKQIQKQLELTDLHGKAINAFNNKNWQDATSLFSEIIKKDPDYKNAKIKLAQAQKEHELETLYDKGLEHYRADNWQAAIKSFEQVTQIQSNYKDVRTYLKKAKEQRRIAEIYQTGKVEYDSEHWKEAIYWFRQIPGYRDADVLLTSANKQIDLEVLYDKGINKFNKRQWKSAKRIFEKIERLEPTYKQLDIFLAKIEDEIEDGGEKTGWRKFLSLEWIGLILAVLGIILAIIFDFWGFNIDSLRSQQQSAISEVTPTFPVSVLEQCLDATRFGLKLEDVGVFYEGENIPVAEDSVKLEIVPEFNKDCPSFANMLFSEWKAERGGIKDVSLDNSMRATYIRPSFNSSQDRITVLILVEGNNDVNRSIPFILDIQ